MRDYQIHVDRCKGRIGHYGKCNHAKIPIVNVTACDCIEVMPVSVHEQLQLPTIGFWHRDSLDIARNSFLQRLLLSDFSTWRSKAQ